MCSVGEMLQVMAFCILHAQTRNAVKQISCGFDSMGGSFKKVGSTGFGVDVQRRADAEVALERVIFGHGDFSLSEELPPFAAKQV